MITPKTVLIHGLDVIGQVPDEQPMKRYTPNPMRPPTTAPMTSRRVMTRLLYAAAASSLARRILAGGTPTMVSTTFPSRKTISVGTP